MNSLEAKCEDGEVSTDPHFSVLFATPDRASTQSDDVNGAEFINESRTYTDLPFGNSVESRHPLTQSA